MTTRDKTNSSLYKVRICELQKRIYELDEEIYTLKKLLREQVALNTQLQDRLDQLRAVSIGADKDD